MLAFRAGDLPVPPSGPTSGPGSKAPGGPAQGESHLVQSIRQNFPLVLTKNLPRASVRGIFAVGGWYMLRLP